MSGYTKLGTVKGGEKVRNLMPTTRQLRKVDRVITTQKLSPALTDKREIGRMFVCISQISRSHWQLTVWRR